MRRLIASVVGLTVWAAALIAALPALGPIAALPAMADTPGVSPTCFSQSLNPHPTGSVGQTSDALFCTPTGSGGNAGTTNNTSGSTGGKGGSTGGNGGSHTTTAGTGSGSGQIQTAGGSTNGAGATTAGGVNGTDGTQSAAASNANAKSAPASNADAKSAPADGGFFGRLTGFLAAAGGLGMLFAFLILLAIVLFIVGVVGWLRRRDGGAAWGSRFARIAHRA